MSDNKVLISDLLSKFEEDIAEPEKNKIESSSVDESDTFSTPDMDVASESATVSNSENISYNIPPYCTTTYPPPVTYSSFNNMYLYSTQPLDNINTNFNFTGKYVYIPNYSEYAYIFNDINGFLYLFTNNMQTGQLQYIANIRFENSEYVVYQNNCRYGIITGNPYEQIWQFIPDSTAVSQNKQYQSVNAKNTNSVKYTFNNVPSEQANDIINTLTKNNPSFPVEINFAPSSANISQQTDTSSSSDIIDTSLNGTNTPYK